MTLTWDPYYRTLRDFRHRIFLGTFYGNFVCFCNLYTRIVLTSIQEYS